MTNIIITGIPRSGTTLTCHLLNKLPDTIALHEPMKIVAKEEFCDDYQMLRRRVDNFFAETRQSLLTDRSAVTKQRAGKVPANSRDGYGGIYNYLPNWLLGRRLWGRSITRPTIVQKSRVTFDKPLTASFALCIKHNGGFVTMLSALVPHYRCFALVRNPLAVLASWNSLEINLYHGHMHTVERMNPALKRDLSQIADRIDRQLFILNWFFEELRQQLPSTQIIRYEALVASQGQALQIIMPAAAALAEPLRSKNQNSLYNRRTMHLLAERLLQGDGAWQHFYSREDIHGLLRAVGGRA